MFQQLCLVSDHLPFDAWCCTYNEACHQQLETTNSATAAAPGLIAQYHNIFQLLSWGLGYFRRALWYLCSSRSALLHFHIIAIEH